MTPRLPAGYHKKLGRAVAPTIPSSLAVWRKADTQPLHYSNRSIPPAPPQHYGHRYAPKCKPVARLFDARNPSWQ
jgi:hypothetical protein